MSYETKNIRNICLLGHGKQRKHRCSACRKSF